MPEKPVMCLETKEIFESQKRAAERYGKPVPNFMNTLKHYPNRTFAGKHWKFLATPPAPMKEEKETQYRNIEYIESALRMTKLQVTNWEKAGLIRPVISMGGEKWYSDADIERVRQFKYKHIDTKQFAKMLGITVDAFRHRRQDGKMIKESKIIGGAYWYRKKSAKAYCLIPSSTYPVRTHFTDPVQCYFMLERKARDEMKRTAASLEMTVSNALAFAVDIFLQQWSPERIHK